MHVAPRQIYFAARLKARSDSLRERTRRFHRRRQPLTPSQRAFPRQDCFNRTQRICLVAAHSSSHSSAVATAAPDPRLSDVGGGGVFHNNSCMGGGTHGARSASCCDEASQPRMPGDMLPAAVAVGGLVAAMGDRPLSRALGPRICGGVCGVGAWDDALRALSRGGRWATIRGPMTGRHVAKVAGVVTRADRACGAENCVTGAPSGEAGVVDVEIGAIPDVLSGDSGWGGVFPAGGDAEAGDEEAWI